MPRPDVPPAPDIPSWKWLAGVLLLLTVSLASAWGVDITQRVHYLYAAKADRDEVSAMRQDIREIRGDVKELLRAFRPHERT